MKWWRELDGILIACLMAAIGIMFYGAFLGKETAMELHESSTAVDASANVSAVEEDAEDICSPDTDGWDTDPCVVPESTHETVTIPATELKALRSRVRALQQELIAQSGAATLACLRIIEKREAEDQKILDNRPAPEAPAQPKSVPPSKPVQTGPPE